MITKFLKKNGFLIKQEERFPVYIKAEDKNCTITIWPDEIVVDSANVHSSIPYTRFALFKLRRIVWQK